MDQKQRVMMKMEAEVMDYRLLSETQISLFLTHCEGGGGGLAANNNAASIQAEQVTVTVFLSVFIVKTLT